MQRRTFLRGAVAATAALALPARATPAPQWIATTQATPLQDRSSQLSIGPVSDWAQIDIRLQPDTAYQTIEGFGGCFNELGAKALNALKPQTQNDILQKLFASDTANLGVCRLPVAANDYALDWYSFNETDGDFAMRDFSLARDEACLIPYIRAAKSYRTELKLWASPWSPPTWMKTNRHYAMAPSSGGQPPNGLTPDRAGHSGADHFIQDARYFDAYALYFRKFLDGYAAHDLPISMVMPQNEFNSAQNFPSCCWTPQGLARFIPHLGKALAGSGTDIFFGTLERPDPAMFNDVYADATAKPYIKGIGLQWAGKGAAPFLHRDHPNLPIYATEQECGDGLNDWRYARYCWGLMKLYLGNGATVYDYWNLILPKGGISTWGWRQNSMVVVDTATGEHSFTHEYNLFRHISQYVRPGAQRIATASWTGYDNALAFRNPDASLVLIVQNDMAEPQRLDILAGDRQATALLPADSFNTFIL